MKYEILNGSGEKEFFTIDSECADKIANEILKKVNELSSNYVKFCFAGTRGTAEDYRDFLNDILENLQELLAQNGCHLGHFVGFDFSKDCESTEYAEYIIETDEGRFSKTCALTLEIVKIVDC